MASHPYISGPNNIAQAVGLLRKNFPATVTSDTIKKYGIASNNESYVINALKFLGLIDEESKRTSVAHDIFSQHDDEEFQTRFEGLVRAAYADLFEVRGDDAWTLNQAGLVSYFRSADKTSDIIGGRQAGVFRVFATLAGHGDQAAGPTKSVKLAAAKPKAARAGSSSTKKLTLAPKTNDPTVSVDAKVTPKGRDMALTVRIEVNLPAGASRQNYDDIFQSMKENLLND